MWIYKIQAKKSKKYGFWKIPKNCLNAQMFRFEEMLKTDDKAKVKSALCNWFSDKIKGADFNVGMNGYSSILLQSDKESEEFDFFNFSIVGDYLLYHTNEIEYNRINFLVKRVQKLHKIVSKIK
jgi:hypothetical protein